MESYTNTGRICSRCGRSDLPILSNGLCIRCDNVIYGDKKDGKRKS